MTENIHVRSFRGFISQRFPEALGAVLPLSDYQAGWTDAATGRVSFGLVSSSVRVTFDDLPFPRPDGTFDFGSGRVVILLASSNNLEEARISAVGEQLMDDIAPRLAVPPPEVIADEAALRAWFPLDRWLADFFDNARDTLQWLDDINALAIQTHLRRVMIAGDEVSFHPSQLGRVCPFETPEGPNGGRILTLAVGARIEQGRILPAEGAEGSLGPSARLVPLLCHNHPTRQLFGVNMIRQMIPPDEPEPPLVRSGLEPEDGSAWLGRNLLTAFMHWKGMNYEDAIVISQSAAAKLASGPWLAELGDKLSNRHGCKGVVGAVLPDDEMPHLPDGRPVELIFDALGVYSRMNFGQIIEATLGLVASARNEPVVAPPFQRTTPEELHSLLQSAGLPESGQFLLRDGRDGQTLESETTVGYVYWGRLIHSARAKIHAIAEKDRDGYLGQRNGRLEYAALHAAAAVENILDAYTTRAISEDSCDKLTARVASGFLKERATPPSPAFRRAQRALSSAGITMDYDNEQVRFAWAADSAVEDNIELAEPLDHPWLPGEPLTQLNCVSSPAEIRELLISANDRLAALDVNTSDQVRATVREALRKAVAQVYETLEQDCSVHFGTRAYLTGRATLAPGYTLKLGEVGIPEDIAWPLFGPLVADQVGAPHVAERGARVKRAIERIMRTSMVIINRAPTWEPTCVTAFRPVLVPGRALLLHPLCCRLFNADFDGDQAAVWLPLSKAAQQEAAQKLTIQGHLQRDPSVVIGHLAPSHAVLVGLAYALETEEGRAEFAALWGKHATLTTPLTRPRLVAALLQVYDEHGAEATLALLERLYTIGLAWATRSGASFSPFTGEGVDLPRPPASGAAPSWYAYAGMVEAALEQSADSAPSLRDPARAVRCGARGSFGHLRAIVGPIAAANPSDGIPIKHGFRDGLEAAEVWELTAASRRSLSQIWESQPQTILPTAAPPGSSVLRQAMDSPTPHLVFARAAAENAVDPLTDPEVRLWMGLLPNDE